MKNNIIYGLFFIAIVFSNISCKKFLDVNKDPNNPETASENLILAPVITDLGTTVAGGTFSNQNTAGIAEINSYWMQEISQNQPLPLYESYKFATSDAQYTWGEMYINIMQNLKRLKEQAEANGNHSYAVISKILMAYSLGATTDMWGDIPYTQAFEGNLHPAYDKQEDVYKIMQSLLDSAIAENSLEPGNLVPDIDDFLYNGDMNKWVKFAYALEARNYIHLTKAPGHNAVVQANLALSAINKAFTGTSDEATLKIYSKTAGHENPWFKSTESSQTVVLSATLINSLVARSDPRLPIIATKGSMNTYLGRINTSDVVPDYSIYSNLGDYFGGNNPSGAGANVPVALLPYSELQFIKAEATFITLGAAAAQPLYQQAILDNMAKLGLNVTSPDVINYLATRGTLTGANALQRIMEEKSIADLLSIENFNDWRRTGFPSLTIVANPQAGITSIPRKYIYPQQEISTNPQPANTNAKITDRVWWDTP